MKTLTTILSECRELISTSNFDDEDHPTEIKDYAAGLLREIDFKLFSLAAGRIRELDVVHAQDGEISIEPPSGMKLIGPTVGRWHEVKEALPRYVAENRFYWSYGPHQIVHLITYRELVDYQYAFTHWAEFLAPLPPEVA